MESLIYLPRGMKGLLIYLPRGMKGSLMATTVAPLAKAARSTSRPIRPNPLIPIADIVSGKQVQLHILTVEAV